jgi:hypothetical protein
MPRRKRVDVNVTPATGHVMLPEHAMLPFHFRMRQSLRDALDEAAARHGQSLNSEIHARLERSFSEERALGGPEMRWLVELAVASFTFAGRMRAPDDPHWLGNQEAYRAGLFALIDSLLAGIPDATPEDIAVEIEGLKGRLLTRLVHQRERERAAQ